mgnify:CR=1 FL=1
MVQGGDYTPKRLYKAFMALLVGLFHISCETTDPTGWRTPKESSNTSLTDLFNRTQRNDHIAMFQIGWRFDTGTGGVKQDFREAAGWYRLSAERGNYSMAKNNLGCLYRDGRGVIQNFKMAATLFRESSELGNPHGKKNLGILYERGYGVQINYPEALRLYTEAATETKDYAGDPVAQNNLGCLYLDGKGTKPDPFTAIKWFRKSANQNCGLGHQNLGHIYELGDELGVDIKKDIHKALQHYKTASDSGNVYAMNAIASLFREGRSVPQNHAKALEYYKMAANKGYAVGVFNLATMHLEGKGVEADPIKAAEWMLKAAAKGNALAQYKYAWMLEKGIGIRRNLEEAIKWYQKSADQGWGPAQLELGMLLGAGAESGIPDSVNAYKWLQLAAEWNNVGAIAILPKIAEEMTPAQILEAKDLAVNFVARPTMEEIYVEPPPSSVK